MKLRYVPIAVLLVLALALALNHAYWAYKVSVERDNLRALGYPATKAEFAEWYALPEGEENAAELYEQAFAAYTTEGINFDHVLIEGKAVAPRHGPLPPEVREETQRFVDANSACIELLREAATIEHCQFPVDFEKYPWERLVDGSSVSRSASFGQSARLLSAALILQLDNADAVESVETLKAQFALARALFQDCETVSPLTAIALDQIALSNIARLLAVDNVSDELLFELDELIRSELEYRYMDHALLTWVNLQLRPAQLILDEPHEFVTLDWFTEPELVSMYLPELLARSDRELWRMLRFAQWYFGTDQKSSADELLRFPPRDILTEAEWTAYHSPTLSFVHTDVYAAAKMYGVLQAVRIKMRAALVASSIERYRLSTGTLPSSLSSFDSKTAETNDPYTGDPLRYTVQGENYWIYSVGPNRQDGGGYDPIADHELGDDIAVAVIRSVLVREPSEPASN